MKRMTYKDRYGHYRAYPVGDAESAPNYYQLVDRVGELEDAIEQLSDKYDEFKNKYQMPLD